MGSPLQPSEVPTLPTPWPWTLRLQNGDNKYQLFKPFGLRQLGQTNGGTEAQRPLRPPLVWSFYLALANLLW